MPMTLAAKWETFRQLLLAIGVVDPQLREMQRGFYAGAAATLDVLARHALDALDEDDFIGALEDVEQEIEVWHDRLLLEGT